MRLKFSMQKLQSETILHCGSHACAWHRSESAYILETHYYDCNVSGRRWAAGRTHAFSAIDFTPAFFFFWISSLGKSSGFVPERVMYIFSADLLLCKLIWELFFIPLHGSGFMMAHFFSLGVSVWMTSKSSDQWRVCMHCIFCHFFFLPDFHW